MWWTTNQTSKYSGCTRVLHKYPYQHQIIHTFINLICTNQPKISSYTNITNVPMFWISTLAPLSRVSGQPEYGQQQPPLKYLYPNQLCYITPCKLNIKFFVFYNVHIYLLNSILYSYTFCYLSCRLSVLYMPVPTNKN